MKYAVIKTGGKQYRVSEGSVIDVEHLGDIEPGKEFVFDRVLLYSEDGDYKIGQPEVTGMTVVAKVEGEVKGDKIRVAKFKAKARYRRVTGHRQLLTRVTVLRFEAPKKQVKEEKKA